MADMNIPANDVPVDQAPAIAPPTRTDDQILPHRKWVPVGKSNYVLDAKTSCASDSLRLTMPSQGKKKTTHLLIQSIRFTKLIIHNLKTKHNIHPRTSSPLYYSHEDNVLGNLKFVRKNGREVFGMPILKALLTDAIISAPYYGGYMAHVAEYQRYLDGEHGMSDEEAVPESPKATKVTKPKVAMQTKPSAHKATTDTKLAGDKTLKPTSSQPPKPKKTSTKPSKAVLEKKRKLVKETPDEPHQLKDRRVV
nr:hypothetical protein [Tanacetum cinerariifolium]